MTRFRLHAGSTLLDFPLPVSAQARTWAATIWPDARTPNGWAGKPWEPGPFGRGYIPAVVELGDVIEFGAQHTLQATTCWYGYLHAVRPDSLLIHGPYPTPHAAHAAAQLAQVQQIHQDIAGGPDPRRPSLGVQLSDTDPGSVPTTPAQPPAAVSVSFHGQQSTVGDPLHGWLVVDTGRLLAAMSQPPDRLADQLRQRLPHLDGREPPLTLAALAAHHLPDLLDAEPTPAQAAAPPEPSPATSAPDAPAPTARQPAPDQPMPSTPPAPKSAERAEAQTPSTPTPPDSTAPANPHLPWTPPDSPGPALPDASL
jgi:hypothetical protein